MAAETIYLPSWDCQSSTYIRKCSLDFCRPIYVSQNKFWFIFSLRRHWRKFWVVTTTYGISRKRIIFLECLLQFILSKHHDHNDRKHFQSKSQAPSTAKLRGYFLQPAEFEPLHTLLGYLAQHMWHARKICQYHGRAVFAWCVRLSEIFTIYWMLSVNRGHLIISVLNVATPGGLQSTHNAHKASIF